MDTGQIEKRWLCIKKWMTRLVAAATACSLLLPISAYAADNQKIGYGQGTAVDAENCPLDALQFDQQFQKFGAYATTPDRKQIILTFDQGYENGYTAKILDVLQEKQAHAIFFLTGDYAKSESELVHRMIEEGHALGNHGMTHASLPTLSPEAAKEEILSLHDYVADTYGYEMQYFRCPCGEYSEQALEIAQECGYQTLFWSFAYVDWLTDQQPDPAKALEDLTSHAHGGEILLLHSVSSTNAEILGDAIDQFRAMGFQVS